MDLFLDFLFMLLAISNLPVKKGKQNCTQYLTLGCAVNRYKELRRQIKFVLIPWVGT